MKNREEFDFLGGALPPPFDEASASDVAIAIHVALVEVGLSAKAIRKVGCALLGVSLGTERRCDASTARQPRGEK
jgi:hypothetical protein